MRVGESNGKVEADANRPFVEVLERDLYTPDQDAYLPPDGFRPPPQVLHEQFVAGRVQMEVVTQDGDGRPERFTLEGKSAQEYVEGGLDARASIDHEKIRENRWQTARVAAKVLRANTDAVVTPIQEAALRQFNLVEAGELLEPRPDGGYRRAPGLKLREDFFNLDFDAPFAQLSHTTTLDYEQTPRGGPAFQQSFLSDVWTAQALSWWAYRHDPVARAGLEVTRDFVLGRGLNIVCEDDKVQEVVDTFWDAENMDDRLDSWTLSLARDGELFVRKLPRGDGTIKFRLAPVATIWEVVTDPEDIEDEKYLVQRYQTRYQLYADSTANAISTWVSRHIPAGQYRHLKINASESEVRGISDLYTVLGWMKRLRDYFDCMVQKEQAAAAYQWHYQIDGGPADIARFKQSLPVGKVEAGSYFLTNLKADVKAVAPQLGRVGGEGTAHHALLNHIALGLRVPGEYLGAASGRGSRATALVNTEPAGKHFEKRQDIIASLLRPLLDDVIQEAIKYGKLPSGINTEMRIGFPEILKADAQVRVPMIARGESMNWISKRTAATQFYSEMGFDEVNYDDEQDIIKVELGADEAKDAEHVVSRDMEQVKKGLPEITDPAFGPMIVPNPAAAGGAGPANPKSRASVADGAGSKGGTAPDKSKMKPRGNAGNASPTSAVGGAKIRNELGREAWQVHEDGGLVIIPSPRRRR